MAQPGHLWILITGLQFFCSDLPGSRTDVNINSLISRGTEHIKSNAENLWLLGYKHTLNADIVRTLEFWCCFLIFFSSRVSLSHTRCWPSWKKPAKNHVSIGRSVQSMFQLLLPILQCGWMIHTQVHQCDQTKINYFFPLQYIHLQSATG